MNDSVIVVIVAILVGYLSFLCTRTHIELMLSLLIVFVAFTIFLLSDDHAASALRRGCRGRDYARICDACGLIENLSLLRTWKCVNVPFAGESTSLAGETGHAAV